MWLKLLKAESKPSAPVVWDPDQSYRTQYLLISVAAQPREVAFKRLGFCETAWDQGSSAEVVLASGKMCPPATEYKENIKG